jgi:hypothetical protein
MVKIALTPGRFARALEKDRTMGLRRLLQTTVAATAMTLAAFGAPALAQDGPMPPPPPMMHGGHSAPGTSSAPGGGYEPPLQMRSSWLAECRDRLHHGGIRRESAAERCERYFDDYYAYYRSAQPAPAYGPVYSQRYSYAAPTMSSGCMPCQRPAMVAPGPAPYVRRGEPECTETVEYEYVDVPVRAAPRRRAAPPPRAVPDKCIRVSPDKRTRVNWVT